MSKFTTNDLIECPTWPGYLLRIDSFEITHKKYYYTILKTPPGWGNFGNLGEMHQDIMEPAYHLVGRADPADSLDGNKDLSAAARKDSKVKECCCPMSTLMRDGCSCGAIAKHKWSV